MLKWTLGVLLLAGCGPLTSGEACDRLGRTWCSKAVQCWNAPSVYGDCMTEIYENCCQGADCAKIVRNPAQVDQCIADTRAQSCSALVQRVIPSSCYGAAHGD
jgi:hypothetical protein